MPVKLRSPLVLTLAVLVAGGAITYVFSKSYQAADSDGINVPVIKADQTAMKVRPSDEGGMDIPYRESSVYDSMDLGYNGEGGKVENLLASEDESNAFEQARRSAPVNLSDPLGDEEDLLSITSSFDEGYSAERKKDVINLTMNESAPEDALNLLQKIEDESAEEAINGVVASAASSATASAAKLAVTPEALAKNDTEAKSSMHAAGTSPETLAFVRSVLDGENPVEGGQKASAAPAKQKTDARMQKIADAQIVKPIAAPASKRAKPKNAPATQASKVEPAAGAAISAGAGLQNYFVQLASVSSASAAEREWPKLRSKYADVIPSSAHRVETADLGARGIYHRIQAGPYSKAQASSICSAIKSRNPGGCLVVKK